MLCRDGVCVRCAVLRWRIGAIRGTELAYSTEMAYGAAVPGFVSASSRRKGWLHTCVAPYPRSVPPCA
eukprot:3413938-Rhodomonas_salina.2